MIRTDARLGLFLALLAVGCSERPATPPQAPPKSAAFRKIRFANDWVVVPFRGGPRPDPTIPGAVPGLIPAPGDRVVLSDAGPGDVFLAGDLDALKFYHSSPGPDQFTRFQKLADDGKLFVVSRGTTATVSRVVGGQLPDGLHALELQLTGEIAWTSDPFVRPVRGDATPRPPG